MEYDQTQFAGAAPYYRPGRPPYSAELASTLAAELGLDGTGHLLDVGSGPGIVGLQLVPLFERVTLLEPDGDMLAEARGHAAAEGLRPVDFVQGTAEELRDLRLPPFRVVTFGQSFHRTDRIAVAESVYDALRPGGALVLIDHKRMAPPPLRHPDLPPIPRDEIEQLVRNYLGPVQMSGSRPVTSYVAERFEETLARTRFGWPRVVHAPGQPDVVRDIDGVVAGCLSMSISAPHLFGGRLDEFVIDLRSLLERRSASGFFWEWPGDTEILIAERA